MFESPDDKPINKQAQVEQGTYRVLQAWLGRPPRQITSGGQVAVDSPKPRTIRSSAEENPPPEPAPPKKNIPASVYVFGLLGIVACPIIDTVVAHPTEISMMQNLVSPLNYAINFIVANWQELAIAAGAGGFTGSLLGLAWHKLIRTTPKSEPTKARSSKDRGRGGGR